VRSCQIHLRSSIRCFAFGAGGTSLTGPHDTRTEPVAHWSLRVRSSSCALGLRPLATHESCTRSGRHHRPVRTRSVQRYDSSHTRSTRYAMRMCACRREMREGAARHAASRAPRRHYCYPQACARSRSSSPCMPSEWWWGLHMLPWSMVCCHIMRMLRRPLPPPHSLVWRRVLAPCAQSAGRRGPRRRVRPLDGHALVMTINDGSPYGKTLRPLAHDAAAACDSWAAGKASHWEGRVHSTVKMPRPTISWKAS